LIGMRAIFSAPRSLTPLVTGAGDGAGGEAEVGSDMALFYASSHKPVISGQWLVISKRKKGAAGLATNH
jgi:hypothetical protein